MGATPAVYRYRYTLMTRSRLDSGELPENWFRPASLLRSADHLGCWLGPQRGGGLANLLRRPANSTEARPCRFSGLHSFDIPRSKCSPTGFHAVGMATSLNPPRSALLAPKSRDHTRYGSTINGSARSRRKNRIWPSPGQGFTIAKHAPLPHIFASSTALRLG
jgi:hypothetical protein